jgi:SpoIID/LytB domain protein
MRRPFVFLFAAFAAALPSAAEAAVPVLVVEGRGHGHGVGMAQDGAFWMGKAGATTNDILGHFYPGTGVGTSSGEVRVVVLPPVAENEAVIAFPNGGEVRDVRGGRQSPGFPLRVPAGGRVRIAFDGARYTAEPVSSVALNDISLAAAQVPDPTSTTTTSTSTTSTSTTSTTTTTTTAPPSPTTTEPPPSTSTTQPSASYQGPPSSPRPLWAVPTGVGAGILEVPARGRRYRNLIEATAVGSALRLVNHIDVEMYLRGMGEVRDPTWPPAALRAQAVAARTYALRAMSRGGELCDTQRCQVYLGVAAEYAAMDKAVTETRGQVLVFGRTLASAVYSANGGGVSASREEGFGTPEADQSYPYLRSAPYTTQDPLPWRVEVALRDVAARLGYRGELTDVRVARTGPSGRAVEVALDGTAGTMLTSGIAFDRALGLKSTLFSLRLGTADAPPPPPDADGDVLQDLPDVVAAPLVAAPAPAAEAVPAVPDLPDAPVVRPTTVREEERPVLPLAAGLGSVGLSGLLLLGWTVARRAGLSGGALRPF